MQTPEDKPNTKLIRNFSDFAKCADYSLIESLNADPQSTDDGDDHSPREIFSGHYVPVRPTPIPKPTLVAYSQQLFDELGLCHDLAHDESFSRLFSADLGVAQAPMKQTGWATGYALSIYGTEYTQQCPFGTGNAYGDGRAISVFEGQFRRQRWEMQLKGSGPTPYCRGADGRAVLRSSVREFLAQELMHALGVPTSRSLSLYMSRLETVQRPWYSTSSRSFNPDVMTDNYVAISTRVAPSFLRVGQIELFARRVRKSEHPQALKELKMIVDHLINRHYRAEIDVALDFSEQVTLLAQLFRDRLIALVTHWIRVGYCQGNFNSDNCAAGGFTLDYGPFGFCERFNPRFQPWTGGGEHFSFFNQHIAAERNFHMFYKALCLLIPPDQEARVKLEQVRDSFAEKMKTSMEEMWASKLGLLTVSPKLLQDLFVLMVQTHVDYTIFFRELSSVPDEPSSLNRSFYQPCTQELNDSWASWFYRWRDLIVRRGDVTEISARMKAVNPAVTWREWLVAPAYQQAEDGDFSLIHELQDAFRDPYQPLSSDLKDKYDRLKPEAFFNRGGISHYSCSS